jgi:hypothetical protein
MRTSTARSVPALIAGAVILAGCGPTLLSPRERTLEDWSPHRADDALMRTAASVPDLALFHHDVAVVCGPSGPGHAPQGGCEVGHLDVDGLTPRGLGPVMTAWWFDDRRLLTLAPDLELALDDGRGGREVLARGALDPRVADDGRHALFVQLDGEPDTFRPGDVGRMTLLDTQTGERRTITDSPLDTSPWLVPGTGEVLFTSARTGLASLWLAADDGTVRQLTNLGKTEVDAGFVPVPSQELVWLPDGHTAVYSSHYDGIRDLWRIDVQTGEVEPLGPGRMPALHPAGGVVAVHDDRRAAGSNLVHVLGGDE